MAMITMEKEENVTHHLHDNHLCHDHYDHHHHHHHHQDDHLVPRGMDDEKVSINGDEQY